jgi:predicted nucleic acid-binding protein
VPVKDTGRVPAANVVVHAYDPSRRDRQDLALRVLRHLAISGQGRMSTQVLGEFFRVVTHRLVPPLSPVEAHAQLTILAQAWPILPITPFVVLEAARGVRDHGLGFWDAQLWATARLNQIALIVSEDFQDGRRLEGVRFANPFAPAGLA